MSQQIDRRGFMHVCATATVASGGMWKLASSASAIEPIVRNGLPKFKFSLAAYSYRHLLTGNPPQLTMADFISDCAAATWRASRSSSARSTTATTSSRTWGWRSASRRGSTRVRRAESDDRRSLE